MSSQEALAAAWREQFHWSATAGHLKKALAWWRRIILVSLVAAAVLAALAGYLDSGSWLQNSLVIGSAAIVVVAPFARARRLSKGAFQNWTRARSASEALKQEIYEYLTQTGDYRVSAQRDDALRRSVDAIVRRVDDLRGLVADTDVPKKPLPPELTVAEYLEFRVNGQVKDYYRPKAKDMAALEGRLRRWEWALAAGALVAVAIAAVAGRSGAIPWVGVVTTVSGTLMAHREAERYEYLAISYSVIANRLDGLCDKWSALLEDGLSAAQEDALVAECEEAISVENQAWMATWTEAPRGV